MKETLGGNVDVSFDNVGSIVKQVKAGQVRALAVMDSERSKFLPDVPTTKELGYPTVISNSTRGIAGPKGMDPKVVAKLQDVLAKAMADPEHVKKLEEVGLAIKVMVGAEYQKYYDEMHERAAKYTEWAKKRPQK
jgi:tripartite-type tricarboxylate transporter receptor subunit TctC